MTTRQATVTGTRRQTAVRLAARLRQSARRSAAADPVARGADWRTQTVAAVGADGTITTSDGVRARRLGTYQAPAAGDWIVITRSGAGSWLALGRLAGSAEPVGAWTTLPLASGFTSPHSGFGLAEYRIVTVAGQPRVELRGAIDASPAVSTETAFTSALPAAACPPVIRSFVGRRNYSSSTIGAVPMEANPDGLLSVFGSASPETSTWFALDGCSYDL